VLAAALIPGAAVLVEDAYACSLVLPESPTELVPDASVIVIGQVTRVEPQKEFTFLVEAYLKGPASETELTFRLKTDLCPLVEVRDGGRAILFVYGSSPDLSWPVIVNAYLLEDGKAYMADAPERTEAEVVKEIRSVTGQYAVPAASDEEGAQIDWVGTVLPVSAALLVVFGIGLLLMRTWHRIDPS